MGQIPFFSAFSAASVNSEVNGTAPRHEHLRFPANRRPAQTNATGLPDPCKSIDLTRDPGLRFPPIRQVLLWRLQKSRDNASGKQGRNGHGSHVPAFRHSCITRHSGRRRIVASWMPVTPSIVKQGSWWTDTKTDPHRLAYVTEADVARL